MGKQPAFQFYPNDWSRDLEEHPLEIEGAWIRICCKLWWSETRGSLTKNLQEWSRILRTSPRQTVNILKHLLKKSISDGQYLDNQSITIISRRMVYDEKIRQLRQRVGKLGGNPALTKTSMDLLNQTSNQKCLTSSSSSSSSSNKDKDIARSVKKPKRASLPPDEDFWKEVREIYTWVDIDLQVQKMKGYMLTPKGKDWKMTRRRVIAWLNRIDRPVEAPTEPNDPYKNFERIGGPSDGS